MAGLDVSEDFLEYQESFRPSTYRSYEGVVRVHLAPGLGHHVLSRLTPQQVQAFFNAKSSSGLAPRTVAYLRAVLRQALTQAERWGLVTRNVAKLAQPPRIARSEIQPLTPEEVRIFLAAIEGDRHEALFLVALGVGLRQGEVLGLTWSDIDLTAATIRVRHALQRVDGRLELVEPKSVTTVGSYRHRLSSSTHCASTGGASSGNTSSPGRAGTTTPGTWSSLRRWAPRWTASR